MPREEIADLLIRTRRAARTGQGIRSAAAGAARMLGLDALTINAVASDGHLELIWADPPVGLGAELDHLQYTYGEGPTLDATHQVDPLIEPDLFARHPTTPAPAERWPSFIPAAEHTKIRAVIATSLRLGVAVGGVLTGYSTTPGPPTPDQLASFTLLGRVLLLLVLRNSPDADADADADADGLYLYRAEVHQATGFIAAELDIPMDQALARLRAYAATHRQPLPELAHGVLTRRLLPPGFA